MTAAIKCFFNNKAEVWDEMNGTESVEKSKRLIRGLRIKPGAKVLDVGCGTGLIIPWLLEAAGEGGSVTAIDIAERMLWLARTKHEKPNIAYLNADITHTPFLDRSFDEIVCHNCFPHVMGKDRAAVEMFRILKPGGRAAICNNESREAINTLHHHIGGDVDMDMLPDGSEMTVMFSRAGFGKISIHDSVEYYLLQAYKPV